MSNANDDQMPAIAAHDRRAFLQRAGLGAAAVGAWVAPQVLFTSVASAGCTPITKLLQINANSCGTGVSTTVNPDLTGCVPVGWTTNQNDMVQFSCSGLFGLAIFGGSITIESAGCTPAQGRAVRYCSLASTKYSCVEGSISGSTITFAQITGPEAALNCRYVDFRITVTCCT